MTEILYTKPRPREIDVTTTIRLQSVGLSARRRVFGMNRSETEIRTCFDTNNPLELIKSSQIYQRHAGIGGLAVAGFEMEKQLVPVGYALAGTKPLNILRRFSRITPVLIKEINIMPGFEEKELGGRLVKEALAGFRANKPVEAYVPEEDVVIGGLLSRLGLDMVPDTEPIMTQDYFGQRHEPVRLYHYRAERIEYVLQD